MITFIKKILRTPTAIEMITEELVEATTSKLEAESAFDYSFAMVQYHNARIDRLNECLASYHKAAVQEQA
jgi:hypothetical protein